MFIKDYIPDAELKQEPVNTSDSPNNPAVYVKLFGSENSLAEGWLLANERNYYDDQKQNLRVEYLWLPSQQAVDKATSSVGLDKPMVSVAISDWSQDYPLS